MARTRSSIAIVYGPISFEHTFQTTLIGHGIPAAGQRHDLTGAWLRPLARVM